MATSASRDWVLGLWVPLNSQGSLPIFKATWPPGKGSRNIARSHLGSGSNPMQSQAGHLIFLCLSFPFCKMGVIADASRSLELGCYLCSAGGHLPSRLCGCPHPRALEGHRAASFVCTALYRVFRGFSQQCREAGISQKN